MTKKITCIIPAWNEAERIGAVLRTALAHPSIDEVIVVDDASTDATAELAEALGARVVRHDGNRGKSAAIATGILAASGDCLMFLDADLVGLTSSDLTRLLSPVLSGQADVSISLRSNAPLPWRLLGIDYISGERVMSRSLLSAHLDHIAGLRRFGLEVFLNDLWITKGVRISVVRLSVKSPLKAEKHGLLRGILGDIGMVRDILRTVGPVQPLLQIRGMLALCKTHPPRPRMRVSRQN